MPRFFLHLREGMDNVLDHDGLDLPNLQAAIIVALRSALDIMAADVREGRLNLNGRIDIHDERGDVVHVVRFRELIDVEGIAPN